MSRRTYNQYCATARTLDLVGERWTLLLIRELLTGPKRFGDVLASAQGMGTGLLAARLKFLQEEGLVQQVTLPPPARTPAYALTEAGAELRPVVMALAQWGMRWALDGRGEDEVFRPGWAVLGMQAVFDAEAAAGVHAVYEFRIDEDVFHTRIDDGSIDSVHGPAQRPDVTITADADTFLALTGGRLSLADAVGDNTVSITGDPQAAAALPNLFRRPAPRSRTE